MKTMAIICEYNPFHNGHAMQIRQHRTMYGVDCVIAVMSGNFVQRGAPAICDKWTRAHMALAGGCDLVLELPVVFSTQSAERFAKGAVSLIDSLRCVDYLSFGSECGNINVLTRAAKIVAAPDFHNKVSRALKSGISYPAARLCVLAETLGQESAAVFSEPNNLLAIEYIRNLLLLGSPIIPITLKRSYSHHAQNPEDSFCSASFLRKQIHRGQDISNWMPDPVLSVLENAITAGKAPVSFQALNILLPYLLRSVSEDQLRTLPDMTEGLESRFIHAGRMQHTFSSIAEAVKTKRYTRTRIDRTLIHLLLGMNKKDFNTPPSYYRVLGMNTVGKAFLRELKFMKERRVITKTAGISFSNSDAERMFFLDCHATDIYALLYPNQDFNRAGLDFITSPILIPDTHF